MFSYKKVGAIRFVKCGSLGFSFWVASKKAKPARVTVASIRRDARQARANRAELIHTLDQAIAMRDSNAVAALLVGGIV